MGHFSLLSWLTVPTFLGEGTHKTTATATLKNQFNPVRLPHFSERSGQDVAGLLVCAACHGGLEVGTAGKEMGNGTDRGLKSTADSTGLLYIVQHGLGPQMCTAPLALPVGRFESSCMCGLRRASPVSVIGYIQPALSDTSVPSCTGLAFILQSWESICRVVEFVCSHLAVLIDVPVVDKTSGRL